jgi:hypothetical protein
MRGGKHRIAWEETAVRLAKHLVVTMAAILLTGCG